MLLFGLARECYRHALVEITILTMLLSLALVCEFLSGQLVQIIILALCGFLD